MALPRHAVISVRHAGTRGENVGSRNVRISGGGAVFDRLTRQASEAALAAMEGSDGLGEIAGRKIGPHHPGEGEFGIGAFPEEKIA